MDFDKEEIPTPLEETIAGEVLKAEVRAWASRIEVEPKGISIRPMRKKWASCSSKGNLSFDVELLRQPPEFRRRVIVHELLHLRITGHTKLFKAMEKAYLEG